MIRVLLVSALLLAVPEARAALSYHQWTFDSVAVLEIQVPADSDLTLGSRHTVNGKAWQEYRLTARPEPRDSILRVRQIVPASDTVRLCTSLEPLTGCRKPASLDQRRSPFWACTADFFFSTVVNPPVYSDTLGLGWGVRILRRSMANETVWAVYRYGTMDTFSVRPGSRDSRELGVEPRFLYSPWSTMDWLRVRGQWRRPDSLHGRLGRDSLMLKGEAFRWHLAGSGEPEPVPGLLTLGLARDLKVFNECFRSVILPEGSRRLVTREGEFVVEGDSVAVDTLLKEYYSTYAMSVTRHYARVRIALADLDSLLRNPPPVGLEKPVRAPSPVRIAYGFASMDAGSGAGRLELVDARGQILSKVSGRGALRLPLVGKGIRWVRWVRGREQGSLSTVL